MTIPYQCNSCGTHFAPGSIGPTPPAINPEKCPVCGGSLSLRSSALDPGPDKRRDGWLWFGAVGGFVWLLLIVVYALGSWAMRG